ncbi:uncharacterized protein LOC134820914 [Bolinopsis microptera]|uniref:uncharacterized protein LOC134820914 n=1 Tax=Bolinopsis microptera TaxID=2820187 RepID=UPI00307AB609
MSVEKVPAYRLLNRFRTNGTWFMAKDPGGFLSLAPCFWFCCIRRRGRPIDDDSRSRASSTRSRSFSYSESSSSDDDDYHNNKIVKDQTGYNGAKENDKITGDGAKYGATKDVELATEQDGVNEPNINTNSAGYSPVPDGDSSDEEGEALTRPLQSLSILSEQNYDEEERMEQYQNSVISSSSSLGEIHVLGDPETYSLTNVSASREQLMQKVGDTSSLDSWSCNDRRLDPIANQADRMSLREDTASVNSWVSRTSATPSAKSLQAESSSVKSWSKEETASLDRQPIKRISATEMLSTSGTASLEDITEAPSAAEVEEEVPAAEQPADPSAASQEVRKSPDKRPKTYLEDPMYSVPQVEHKKAAEPVPVQPVPSIEVDSAPDLQQKESIKSKTSDDSGVVVDKYISTTPRYKSQSAVFSDDAVSLQSATSMVSLDAAGLPKKKKKLKLFKKFKFKKKKKNKLLVQQQAGYSASTPTLGADADAASSTMSVNSKSRYSASLLLASLDDLSDDDICKD